MHNLIVGVTHTGKTNLCKSVAAGLSPDVSIIVFDPLRSTGWPERAIKFHTTESFFAHIESARQAYVFVDEGKTLWDADQKQADTLLYRRRHQGLLIFLIAQRAKMIPPNARTQCSKIFAFKQQADDSKLLGEEFGPELRNAQTLEKNEFIMSDGFVTVNGKLDYSNGLPPEVIAS